MGIEYRRYETVPDKLLSDFRSTIQRAVNLCTQEGTTPRFGHVVVAANRIISQEQSEQLISLFLPFNSPLILAFLQDHQSELGVNLYSRTLTQHVDIEPGNIISIDFKESLGFLLTDQLPQTFERVKSAPNKPVFQRLDQCERGIVGLLNIDDQLVVVKFTSSWSNDSETEVARLLGEKGLAPRVFEATELAIAEEYISHPSLSTFLSRPGFVGHCLGKILSAIHQTGIVYGNSLMNHVRVKDSTTPQPQIIDLEIACRGNDFSTDWQIATKEIRLFFHTSTDTNTALKAMSCWQNH